MRICGGWVKRFSDKKGGRFSRLFKFLQSVNPRRDFGVDRRVVFFAHIVKRRVGQNLRVFGQSLHILQKRAAVASLRGKERDFRPLKIRLLQKRQNGRRRRVPPNGRAYKNDVVSCQIG